MEVKDSNGELLNDGDAVLLIKDLKVNGTSTTLKRGTKIKNIRLTDNEEEVDCKVDGHQVVLKACFLNKVTA
ncbi:MAG: zinc ribbon domain-containing protein YjdM [Saprospiraceae bacterium]|nr:zinc ribbon domain-containing protein YjdM [Saprospiraceae bacterium]MDZ4703226.1 zinc ribbon domain-containing protein YjdM [Saprospiraceae bacterium]